MQIKVVYSLVETVEFEAVVDVSEYSEIEGKLLSNDFISNKRLGYKGYDVVINDYQKVE